MLTLLESVLKALLQSLLVLICKSVTCHTNLSLVTQICHLSHKSVTCHTNLSLVTQICHLSHKERPGGYDRSLVTQRKACRLWPFGILVFQAQMHWKNSLTKPTAKLIATNAIPGGHRTHTAQEIASNTIARHKHKTEQQCTYLLGTGTGSRRFCRRRYLRWHTAGWSTRRSPSTVVPGSREGSGTCTGRWCFLYQCTHHVLRRSDRQQRQVCSKPWWRWQWLWDLSDTAAVAESDLGWRSTEFRDEPQLVRGCSLFELASWWCWVRLWCHSWWIRSANPTTKQKAEGFQKGSLNDPRLMSQYQFRHCTIAPPQIKLFQRDNA